MSNLVFATRPSALARWQTRKIIQELEDEWNGLTCQEVVISTKGDQTLDRPLPEIGGKGLFTFELEQALNNKRVHAAVHSLKDLPTEEPTGLVIGAIYQRGDGRDVLFCPAGSSLDELPSGCVVGTSSVRRKAQLLARRPDLKIESIRGNVDTRIRKAREGQYDAIILAAAGLLRLGLEDVITQYLPMDFMLPAPGQGALAVQCRADDEGTLRYLQAVDHRDTRAAVQAERTFLSALGGGCSLPVGAYAHAEGDKIAMQAVVVSTDGRQVIRVSGENSDADALGMQLAREAILAGAEALLQ